MTPPRLATSPEWEPAAKTPLHATLDLILPEDQAVPGATSDFPRREHARPGQPPEVVAQ
jgi:hypothetical protein